MNPDRCLFGDAAKAEKSEVYGAGSLRGKPALYSKNEQFKIVDEGGYILACKMAGGGISDFKDFNTIDDAMRWCESMGAEFSEDDVKSFRERKTESVGVGGKVQVIVDYGGNKGRIGTVLKVDIENGKKEYELEFDDGDVWGYSEDEVKVISESSKPK